MTVKQMKRVLKKLPDDMDIMMPIGEDTFAQVCKQNSEVVDIDIPDNPEDENSVVSTYSVLLLVPCNCHEEIPLGDINSQPELN